MNFLSFLLFVFSLISVSLASYPPQEESGSGPENTFLNEGKKTQESPLKQHDDVSFEEACHLLETFSGNVGYYPFLEDKDKDPFSSERNRPFEGASDHRNELEEEFRIPEIPAKKVKKNAKNFQGVQGRGGSPLPSFQSLFFNDEDPKVISKEKAEEEKTAEKQHEKLLAQLAPEQVEAILAFLRDKNAFKKMK